MTESYEQFCQWVDTCESEEQLQQYRKDNAATALRNEFWKQRKLAMGADSPLEKQRALVKTHWLQQYFSCRIPMTRAVNQFAAPEGLYGIFISQKAAVGTGCVIFQNVSIGSNTLPDAPNAGFPVVGNNVHIGAGAVISGGVVIGDNVRIAPNSCVTVDVPANSVVTGSKIFVETWETAPENQHLTPDQFLKQRFERVIYDYEQHLGDPLIHVEQATAADIDAVMQLYKDRINWFRWKKVPQWGHYLQHHPREDFLERINAGEYYVLKRGEECIGGFALLEDSDHWQDEQTNAYYLRRAVAKVGYKNLGRIVAAEAKKIADAAGKEALRLECIYENERLNALWENLGFAFVRDAEGSYHCSLRQWKEKEPETPEPTEE